MSPRASLDGWKISSPPGFDPGPSSPYSVAIPTELPRPTGIMHIVYIVYICLMYIYIYYIMYMKYIIIILLCIYYT